MRDRLDPLTAIAFIALLLASQEQERVIKVQGFALDQYKALALDQRDQLDTDLDFIHQQDTAIADLEDQQRQLVRAITDLGLNQLIAQRLIANVGLDILAMGEDITTSPLARALGRRLLSHRQPLPRLISWPAFPRGESGPFSFCAFDFSLARTLQSANVKPSRTGRLAVSGKRQRLRVSPKPERTLAAIRLFLDSLGVFAIKRRGHPITYCLGRVLGRKGSEAGAMPAA